MWLEVWLAFLYLLFCAVPYWAVRCCTVLCRTYRTELYRAVPCCTVPTVPCCTVQCCTIPVCVFLQRACICRLFLSFSFLGNGRVVGALLVAKTDFCPRPSFIVQSLRQYLEKVAAAAPALFQSSVLALGWWAVIVRIECSARDQLRSTREEFPRCWLRFQQRPLVMPQTRSHLLSSPQHSSDSVRALSPSFVSSQNREHCAAPCLRCGPSSARPPASTTTVACTMRRATLDLCSRAPASTRTCVLPFPPKGDILLCLFALNLCAFKLQPVSDVIMNAGY